MVQRRAALLDGRAGGRVLGDVDLAAALAVCARDAVGSVLATARSSRPSAGPCAPPGAPCGATRRTASSSRSASPAPTWSRSSPWRTRGWRAARSTRSPGSRAARAGAARRSSPGGRGAGPLGPSAPLLAGGTRGARRPALDGDRARPAGDGRPARAAVPPRGVRRRPARLRPDVHRGGRLLAGQWSRWPYETRVHGLIAQGRSFVRIDPAGTGTTPGAVVFKAELGAVAGGVAQVQGVWVSPDRRGGTALRVGDGRRGADRARRGGAPGVALRQQLQPAGARRVPRGGFRKVGTYATVLF